MDPNFNRRLREALARLCDDPATTRMIAHDAGLDLSRIDLSGSSQVRWQAVIDEAVRQSRERSLIRRARSAYPADSALRDLHVALDPDAKDAVSQVVAARKVPLAERHALVVDLVRRARDEEVARRCAREADLTLPATQPDDHGARWTWLVQQLHLRNLNLAPLYAAAGRALPSV